MNKEVIKTNISTTTAPRLFLIAKIEHEISICVWAMLRCSFYMRISVLISHGIFDIFVECVMKSQNKRK